MSLVLLNWISFVVCVLSIIATAAIGITMIWSARSNPELWKWFWTAGIIFFASAVTLSASKALVRKAE